MSYLNPSNISPFYSICVNISEKNRERTAKILYCKLAVKLWHVPLPQHVLLLFFLSNKVRLKVLPIWGVFELFRGNFTCHYVGTIMLYVSGLKCGTNMYLRLNTAWKCGAKNPMTKASLLNVMAMAKPNGR